MRVLGFERKRDKVRAAGGRVPHIDKRVAQSAEHARAYGGDEPLAGVNRQERRYVVNKERGEDHAPDAAKKKPAAEQPVAENRHRDVENDRHHADGQAEQPVEDQRETRKAGHRELGRQCKVIDGDAGQDAPGNFHERIEHPRLSEQLSHGGRPSFPLVSKNKERMRIVRAIRIRFFYFIMLRIRLSIRPKARRAIITIRRAYTPGCRRREPRRTRSCECRDATPRAR